MTTLPASSNKLNFRKAVAGICALAAMPLLGAQPAATETATPNVATRSVGEKPAVAAAAATAEPMTEIQRFCSNIADAARDRRYSLQAKELETLQAEIDKRMKALEEKRAEYEEWLKRRNDFMAEAEEGVVKIYARMRPDAAAERLAEVNTELAAAILMKLDSRQAGVILNEMERKAAATLTGIMASAARKEDPT
jgi:flagellar motility protein MotE (MotC chaperone)